TADECQRLPAPVKQGELLVQGGDMIIYVAGYPAIYGKQILYFNDPVYLARSQIPAPEQSDKLIEPVGSSTIGKIKRADEEERDEVSDTAPQEPAQPESIEDYL
ncbi:hypothetical protein L2748_23585, partial [Shewanella sairae]|nr:hypothetical protein [Shewanella sairae]